LNRQDETGILDKVTAPAGREWRTNRAAIRERNAALASYWEMQWIEALINISALAGFVGVANLGQKIIGREGRRSNGSKLEWSDRNSYLAIRRLLDSEINFL
jgi:hypothetical protein